METMSKAGASVELHDSRCILRRSLTSPAAGMYSPKCDGIEDLCTCAALRANDRLEANTTRHTARLGPKSSLKTPLLGGSSNEELRPRSGEPPLRSKRLCFDLRSTKNNARVQEAALVDIVEPLIRLSILSALIYSPEGDSDTPIYRTSPRLIVKKLLPDAELPLLEEGSIQSQNDFNESIQSYVRTLPRDDLLDRMMQPSTLPYLPHCLDLQATRFQLAMKTNDRLPLIQYKDEKYRLSMDRKRLRDDYHALLRLQSCLEKVERDEQLHSSILIELKRQVDILMPQYRSLNTLLSLPLLGIMLG
ncbi:uncharacterized protein BP5553_06583 [Venustampulla echinocandica]|uniref:Uncharacterized protein n=1 Tax=Venustampulla echinocandica TaxID=2656787 RepID=A0A370TKC2_9HELO|nr:uncharacterized protein BP5553_06583 [Venustampulla echinocandica]RDL35971.1 hypothetical protein BP5553_06583 [Venustampulla echinocandica]